MELSEFPWAEIEKRAIEAHIQSHRGSKKAAAASLQVSLKTLYNKLKLYGWELRWDYPGSLRIERVLAMLRGTSWTPLCAFSRSQYLLELFIALTTQDKRSKLMT
jgi:Bacterial regulatory protein, Fis family